MSPAGRAKMLVERSENSMKVKCNQNKSAGMKVLIFGYTSRRQVPFFSNHVMITVNRRFDLHLPTEHTNNYHIPNSKK